MARLDIVPKDLAAAGVAGMPALTAGALAATAADFTFVAPGVASDGISFTSTGRELLVVRNNSAGALTVTITSVPLNGRTGDVTAYSVGANGFSVFGPLTPAGFEQAARKIYAVGSTTGILFAVLRLPPVQ